MKTIILTLAVLMFVPGARAQQWSKDPVADHLLQLQSDLLKAQEVLNYCEEAAHRQEKICDGVNDGTPSKWMDYEKAKALGQKQSDQDKEHEKSPTPTTPSLGEVARQLRLKHQLLKTQVEQVVNDYCSKHFDATSKLACSDKTALVQGVVSRREANGQRH
jgi:hypothetical protein